MRELNSVLIRDRTHDLSVSTNMAWKNQLYMWNTFQNSLILYLFFIKKINKYLKLENILKLTCAMYRITKIFKFSLDFTTCLSQLSRWVIFSEAELCLHQQKEPRKASKWETSIAWRLFAASARIYNYYLYNC